MTTQTTPASLNGIDVATLGQIAEGIAADPSIGFVKFNVATHWTGGTTSETKVDGYSLDGQRIERNHVIKTDEPRELLGTDKNANPQEVLMASLNACMTVGFVAGCAMHGITLDSLCFRTDGQLNLRGFLGLDAEVAPGPEEMNLHVEVAGNGTQEQYDAILEHVMATSPNFFNVTQPVAVHGELSILEG